jgi:hypothetical protein
MISNLKCGVRGGSPGEPATANVQNFCGAEQPLSNSRCSGTGGRPVGRHQSFGKGIFLRRLAMLIRHCAAERGRLDHFDVRSVPQNVHYDFLGMAVRNLEQNAAIWKYSRPLVRVPLLLAHPARGLGVEDQGSDVLSGSSKNSIPAFPWSGCHFSIQCRFVQDGRFPNGINGEPPRGVLLVAPRVQIPIPAVVKHPLGRDDAIAFNVASAGIVPHSKSLPAKCSLGDGLEVPRVGRTLRRGSDRHPVQNAVTARMRVSK